MEPRRLVIIDGYSLLYRAFFATRYLSTSDGRPTNALFGFVGMLFLLLEKVRPHAVVVALDAPGKTFRHADFAEYKATRKETQDELRVQLVSARELIAKLGIPSVEATGFEADDVVGTISRKAEENGYHTTIVTGDLDALQLVDDCVSVMTPGKGVSADTVTYDEERVRERFGFGPERLPDFKALKGDTSDNIPGVPGIGDKGAAELIQKFGTIEEMLARKGEMEPKYLKRIEGNEEQMLLSKRLATISRDAPVEYDFQPFVLTQEQFEAAGAMLESYEMRTHVRRAPIVLGPYVGGAPGEGPAAPTVQVEEEAVEARFDGAVDFEGLRAFVGDGPYSVFFASATTQADLFAESERRAFVATGVDVREASEPDALRLVAECPTCAILHDAKAVLRRHRLYAVPRFDTMLGAYVLQSGRAGYMLRDLVQGYLEATPPTKPEDMAAALFLLEAPLRERLGKEEQTRVLEEIEMPLLPILAEMENHGIAVNREGLREFSRELEGKIEGTRDRIFELAGREFTIGSPKQLGEVLFEEMGLPGSQKTKTGYATGVEVLSVLAAEHEIASEVLNWRELTKLKSTYADSLEKLIAEDGRIHTTYNQTVAATGRLSSNDPNLQNIPIRTELGRGIRKAFVAGPGHRLLSMDYSQIELRVLAHMCGEPALVEAFARHQDVHTATACEMFGLSADAPPSQEQRRLAKLLNYAVLYGVTEYGLAQQLGAGFSIAEAKALIQQYNERFPSVQGFTASVVAEAKSKGFTTTLHGRRRYFPDIHAPKINERRYAERQAMNAPIQGTAADMIKLAMIRVHERLQGHGTRMLLNVHDELVFEMPHGEEHLIEPLRGDMENALPLEVPVEVDAKIGNDWNEMEGVGR